MYLCGSIDSRAPSLGGSTHRPPAALSQFLKDAPEVRCRVRHCVRILNVCMYIMYKIQSYAGTVWFSSADMFKYRAIASKLDTLLK